MSAWIDFLGKFYRDKKKSNPGYSYKNAMKDAAKVYSPTGETCTERSRKTKSRKSKKKSSSKSSSRRRKK